MSQATDEVENSGSLSVVKLLLAAGLAGALIFAARQLGGYLPEASAWIEGLGAWGPVAFIAAYAAATLAFVPGAVLTLTGGALFHLIEGTLYVFTAAVIGSSLAFLIARYLARNLIASRLEAHPKFAAIDAAVADQGFKIVFLLRLSPAIPFSFMNYALGLTRVRFRDYVLASVGMLPGTLLYVYYGKVAGDAAAFAAGAAPDKGSGYYLVLALGLAATVAVTAIVTRLARKALAETTKSAEDSV